MGDLVFKLSNWLDPQLCDWIQASQLQESDHTATWLPLLSVWKSNPAEQVDQQVSSGDWRNGIAEDPPRSLEGLPPWEAVAGVVQKPTHA